MIRFRHICMSILLIAALLAMEGCGSDSSAPPPAPNSADNPDTAAVGTPLAATVDAGGSYYVTFTREGSGDMDISLAGNNLSWILFDDAAYTAASTGISPMAIVTDCPSGSCTTSNLSGGTAYYLIIQNTGAVSEAFTLTVQNGLGQGRIADPVVLTGVLLTDSYAASVSTGNSYYKIELATPTSNWCVVASGSADSETAPSEDVDLFLYSDAGFSVQVAADEAGAPPQVCHPTSTDTVYIRADGGNTTSGITFFIRFATT